MSESAETPQQTRQPLTYHQKLADYLQAKYPELWNWVSTAEAEQKYADAVLLELNKTGREITDDKRLQSARSAQRSLGIDEVNLTLWEIPDREGVPDVSVFWIKGEAHVALRKSYFQSHSDDQIQTAFGSALIRWQLWNNWEGRFRIAERLLGRMLAHARRDVSAVRETLQRWNRATDQFVKSSKEEPLTKAPLRWDEMDLLERDEISQQTRDVIRRLLAPDWFQTKAVLALARQYFADFDEREIYGDVTPELFLEDDDLADFFCYLLLDFAAVDRSLGVRPVQACLKLSREIGCEARFQEVLTEELG